MPSSRRRYEHFAIYLDIKQYLHHSKAPHIDMHFFLAGITLIVRAARQNSKFGID